MTAWDEGNGNLAALLANANVGMATVGLDGRVQRVSDSFCRILGRTDEELVGHLLVDVTDLGDHEGGLDDLRRLVAGEIEIVQREKRYQSPAGVQAWVRRSVAAVKDASGDVSHLLIQVEDLTEQRRVEDRLEAKRILPRTRLRPVPGLRHLPAHPPERNRELRHDHERRSARCESGHRLERLSQADVRPRRGPGSSNAACAAHQTPGPRSRSPRGTQRHFRPRLLKRLNPDVIVLDHVLAGMSGVETVPLLRRAGHLGPILLFSQFLPDLPKTLTVPLDVWPISKTDHETLLEIIDAYATQPPVG